ncbi:TPA: RNA-processing protein [Candidatus Micrarchaeota archaeon]|nr:RNA-processing protein [Candidatus Micrarchaeota archaeon]
MSRPQLRLYVNIPLERVGALIGEKGEVKEELMRRTRTLITVDSENGVVIIEPESPDVPPYSVMKAQEVVKAIGYGFPPQKAFRLLDEDQVLVVIDLKRFAGDSPNHLKRIKGRIIGENGKARRTLEEVTGTYIVVGEAHVAIIGGYEEAEIARRAVEMLVEGRRHSTVYRFLERAMSGVKRRRMFELWEPG